MIIIIIIVIIIIIIIIIIVITITTHQDYKIPDWRPSGGFLGRTNTSALDGSLSRDGVSIKIPVVV